MSDSTVVPKPAVIGVVIRNGLVLLVRRSNPSDAGKWSFPAEKSNGVNRRGPRWFGKVRKRRVSGFERSIPRMMSRTQLGGDGIHSNGGAVVQ